MRFIALAVVSMLVVTCPAVCFAQTATQDIQISAQVNATCTINNAANGGASAATIGITAAGAVDTTTQIPTGSAFANVACNAPSKLQLTSQSGGARTASAAVTGFTGRINYTATATWNSVSATIDTSSAGASGPYSGAIANVLSAYSGSLSVSITPTANTQPLLAGTYSDVLRVTLIPN